MLTTIPIPYPTTCYSAIRTVMYLRGWRTLKPLADALGLADTTRLSRLVRHHEEGTPEMLARIIEHMPAKEAC